MPIRRRRQDVLHAPKATNPRAAAATAANIPNTFSAPTDNPYQPPTSYLLSRLDAFLSSLDTPTNEMNAAEFNCKFWDARRRLIRPGKAFLQRFSTVSKRNYAVKVKRGTVREHRDHTGIEWDRKLLF